MGKGMKFVVCVFLIMQNSVGMSAIINKFIDIPEIDRLFIAFLFNLVLITTSLMIIRFIDLYHEVID